MHRTVLQEKSIKKLLTIKKLQVVVMQNLSGAEQKRRFLLRKRGISPEAFKTGSSVGGAQKAVPADTTGTSTLVKTDSAPDLSSDVTPEGEAGAGEN